MRGTFTVIPTSRRIDYAYGYLALGLISEATVELGSIREEDQLKPEVLSVCVELHMATKDWQAVAKVARQMTEQTPGDSHGWISWAYATRRCVDIPAAEAILLKGEKCVGAPCPTIDYNLACYYCLLGEIAKAKTRFENACRRDAGWKQAALADEDLRAIWDHIALMP